MRDPYADFEHELSLLKRNVKQAWCLKIFLVVLYLPLIALVALSWPNWSDWPPTKTPQHDKELPMIQSERHGFFALRSLLRGTDLLLSTSDTIKRDKARNQKIPPRLPR